MTYMNVAKALWSRIGLKGSLLIAAAILAILAIVPNINSIADAEDGIVCTPTFTTPQFNAYPVSYNHPTGEPCHEFPAIQGRTSSGSFPRSQSEWAAGTTASANQEVLLQSWIHNSAAPGNGKIFNAKYSVTVDTSVGSSHVVTVRFTGDNVSPFTSSYVIHTAANESLEFVEGSGSLYDYQGNVIDSGFDVGNGTIELGNIRACFENALFVSFRVRVVPGQIYPTPPQNGCIDILKETFDVNGNPLTPVTQFTFKLDNDRTVSNDGTGRARFSNVPVGTHTVTETVPSTWTQLSVTPAGGVVSVTTGTSCAVVTFKNKQQISYPTPTYPTPTYPTPTYPTPTYPTPTYPTPTYPTPTYPTPTYPTPTYPTPSYPTPPPSKGCITVIKEAFDTNGNLITPVPQFSFQLDNGQTVANDGSGRVTFSDVSVGTHQVAEISLPNNWTLLSVAPVDGRVTVTAGSNCAVVLFKNKQHISYPTPSQNGCITVIKEAFDTTGHVINPVPQFSFRLDNDVTIYNNGTGRATFNNVSTGSHTVREINIPSNWELTSVNPSDGHVSVSAGSNCATVTFKNKQHVSYPTPSSHKGCITVIKEAFDTNGNLITPVPKFTFELDNDQTATNNSNGRLTFNNVSVGRHFVTETSMPNDWQLLSVAPVDGRVQVSEGSDCATVLFKNRQRVTYTTPTTPNLVFSKKAWNDTQNKDATYNSTANREDYITYTLTVTNTGSADSKNFVITDDLSGILPFADVTNKFDGTVSGNTITFPAVTVPAGKSVSKTFQVRVKFHLAAHQSFLLTNTYGNRIDITIPGKTILVAPKTGSNAISMTVFAGLITGGYVAFRKRKGLINLIWA